MLGAGWATSLALSLVGALFFVLGMARVDQPVASRARAHARTSGRAGTASPPIAGRPGTVDQLRAGMAGYRFQLPLSFHPISSGVKGGIVGGLLMPIPALAYGILSDHGIWFPVNLLAGIVLPGISGEHDCISSTIFSSVRLSWRFSIHATFSLTFGLLFGVISPTLPPIPGGPIIAGGVLMPFLWSGLCHGFMGIINPSLQRHVNWFWFVVSQVVYRRGHVDRRHQVPEGASPAGRQRPARAVGIAGPSEGGGHPETARIAAGRRCIRDCGSRRASRAHRPFEARLQSRRPISSRVGRCRYWRILLAAQADAICPAGPGLLIDGPHRRVRSHSMFCFVATAQAVMAPTANSVRHRRSMTSCSSLWFPTTSSSKSSRRAGPAR